MELRAWRKNGKVTSRPIIGSIDPKCGTLSAPVKKLHSCGPFGIRLWQPMSGRPKLLRPLFPNNAHFSSRTLVNQSSTNFGTVSKQGGHGNGPYSSCMNSVGLERVITIASIGSKHCLERGSKGNLSKKSKFGIFFVALRYGQFGSNVTTKCSTMNNGMNQRSNTRFGMSYSCMQGRHGNGCSSKLRSGTFLPRPCLKVLTVRGVLGISFVGGTTLTLNGIGGEE